MSDNTGDDRCSKFGRGALQTYASLKKNFIEKRRNPCGCCCEFFSHFILFILLLFGYSLSKIDSFSTMYYADINLAIPPWLSTTQQMSSTSTTKQNFSIGINNTLIYENITTILNQTSSSTMMDINSLITSANDLFNGPLQAPSFDLFVTAARAITNLTRQNSALLDLLLLTPQGSFFYNIVRFRAEMHFAPDTALTRDLIQFFNESTTTFNTLKVVIHRNEAQAIKAVSRRGIPFALIVVNDVSPSNAAIDIRMDYRVLPNTNLVIDDTALGLDTAYQMYYFSGFLTLQTVVDNWLWHKTGAVNSTKSSQCSAPPTTTSIPFPTMKYQSNNFYVGVGFLLGLAMTMSTLYPMSRLSKSVVEEKESRMREVMKIMGLYDWANQMSWFITAFVTFFWIAASSTFLSKVSFLSKSDTRLLFAYFFLFCMSEISLAFFVAVFFSNSKLAAIFAPVFLFITLLPKFAFINTNVNEAVQEKFASCLLPGTAFSFGADLISNYEYVGIGIQFSNWQQGDFNFSIVLGFLLLDTFLYGFLAWYFDQVWPHEVGASKSPWFLFTTSFWLPSWNNRNYVHIPPSNIPELLVSNDFGMNPASSAANENESVEIIPRAMRGAAKVKVSGLLKRYDNGKVAVRNVNFALLQDQITVLLGHNGAGKTTAISMLTGMITTSSGQIEVYGRDLAVDLASIRQEIGICPQYNVLFPSLTVREHLFFFGNLKGLIRTHLRSAVTKVIEDVGLTEKEHVLSSALSGGMKRKLCLAIALIGDPKFLLLDEPTSGMDPYSRRSTWEMLQNSKKDRVVLLTTHFMDEADILGDRIIIMSEGQIRCSGSSLFLKSKFGAGYVLSLTKTSASANMTAIEASVRAIVAGAELSSAVAGEIIFRLPISALSAFADLFKMLVDQAATLEIGSYGISLTSLEQVFISLVKESQLNPFDIVDDEKVVKGWGQIAIECIEKCLNRVFHRGVQVMARDAVLVDGVGNVIEEDVEANVFSSTSHLDLPEVAEMPEDVEVYSLMWIQLYELLMKRLVIARRDIKGFVFSVIFPALQILGVLAILTININPAGGPLTMNASILPASPGIVVAGTPTWPEPYLFNRGLNIIHKSNPTSSNLSYDLIADYYVPHPVHYGGFVFKDVIKMNLNVYWPFVKDFVRAALKSDAFGVSINGSSFELPNIGTFSTSPLNPVIISALSALLPNSSTLSLTGITLNSTVGDALDALFNVTAINNNTLGIDRQSIVSTIDGFLNISSINVTLSSLSLSYYSIEYVPSSEVIRFNNVTIGVLGVFVRRSSIDIPIEIFFRLFPNDNRAYTLDINSRYTIMMNSTGPHTMSALRGELMEVSLAQCLNNEAFEYSIRNHPMPITAKQAIQIKIIISLFTSIFILIPLCYIPSAFIVFIVKERVCKSTHLQFVSSVSPYLYWVSVYIWDVAQYSILTLLTMCFFFIYGKESSQVFVNSAQSTLAVFLLLFFYGTSIIPLAYLYSLTFTNYSTAQISIMSINFFTGFVFVLAYFVMSSIPLTADIAKQLVNFFRLFPGYLVGKNIRIQSLYNLSNDDNVNLGEGLIKVSTSFLQLEYLNTPVNYFSWEVAGRCITFLVVESIGYFLCVLLTEFSWFRRMFSAVDVYQTRLAGRAPLPVTEPDVDVTEEMTRIQAADPADYALFIKDIVKTFPPSVVGGKAKYAVRGVSLGCSVGERFGLLGINGAGKTTTLALLTGDIQPTSGDAFVAGLPLSDPNTRKYIGFCPQVDPLLDLMTGYETLWFFGRIRGIGKSELHGRVNRLIEDVGLTHFASKPCGTYSGGNKRKLSLAVALIGDPKLLLLDEPSTGMDPEARRHMWDVISHVSEARSVVLTTHSMEECEALCTRVGIMVSGRLQCLGSSQHLKSRFGTGYQVEIRCTEGRTEDTLAFCQREIPVLHMEEHHGTFLRFMAPASLDLAWTFQSLEGNKAPLGISNYSVSQATLEQVFIKFAKEQEEEKGNRLALHGIDENEIE